MSLGHKPKKLSKFMDVFWTAVITCGALLFIFAGFLKIYEWVIAILQH